MLSLLADNRFQIRVAGLEESRLIENLQKIANRITTGLITAALIVAAAMIMRIETTLTAVRLPGTRAGAVPAGGSPGRGHRGERPVRRPQGQAEGGIGAALV